MTTPDPAARTAMLCGPWATPGDLTSEMLGSKTTEQWERWLTIASETLFWLSGERWSGVGCTYTASLRGHPPEQGSGAWPYYRSWGMTNSSPSYWWYPLAAVAWLPIYRSRDPLPYAVKLPHDEVTAITAVTINGATLDPSRYRLVPGGWLERTDCREWGAWLDQTTVTYAYGTPPPESGVQAAVVLANEISKAECGDASCRLPKRITSVTRQGVSIAVIDSMDFYKIRKTGLPDVDLWLTGVNPKGRLRRARVISPDIPRVV